MKSVLAILYATAAAVLAATGAAFIAGHLTVGIAVLSLCVGVGLGVFSLWSTRRLPTEPWKVDVWGGAALFVFALFALRSFLWVAFYSGDGLMVFSPNNLGDLALHLTYVRYLAHGAPFWPENPIFAGAPLTYPIGIDLVNSLLALVGVDEIRGFVWVGLIAGFCTAAMLWRWGRGFVVAGFLFAGGTLGFEIFRRGELLDYQSDAAWSKVGLIVAWKSLPLALFVTQRGLWYAIPAGLAVLASWRSRLSESGRAEQRLPLWGEVLLYASMPIFHLHTFLFLSAMAAAWFCFAPLARRHLFIVVAISVIPATALVWCVTGAFHGASVLGWMPGWMQGTQNFFVFWLTNFGVFLPLTGVLVFLLLRKPEKQTDLLIVLPALAVFVICCFVKFAPWEWDNTKLMIWSYLLVLPSLWQVLLMRWPEWARTAACIFLFFSGAVSLLGGLSGRSVVDVPDDAAPANLGYTVGVRSEMEQVKWATRRIPITDRFISFPNYNHPLLLSGRLVAMGYEGHAWSHGLDYRDRKEAVERVLRGEEGWRETAQQLGARWIFWGEQERANYPNSPQPWKGTCVRYASGPWGELYDLVDPVKAAAAAE